MNPGAAHVALAVLRHLHANGVREIVLAPGSRSGPLALAAFGADRAGDLRLHVRVDERSAGFLALGLSMASRRPVAVVVTSGTAVGNLLPAVMEARHSGRAVVVVSADRPDRLRGTGANQTTHQAGIFGVFAPTWDLPVDVGEGELAVATANACQLGGPVHLNVQLAEPLLPASDPGRWWAPILAPDTSTLGESESGHRGEHRGEPGLDREALEIGPRTVVVAGDDAGPAARLLAEAAGWPLLAEPTSGARIGENAMRCARLLLDSPLGEQIERVIVIGHPTLSRPVSRLLAREDVDLVSVVGPGGIATDPNRRARVRAEVPTLQPEPREDAVARDRGWLRSWQESDRVVSEALDRLVDDLAEQLAQHGPAGVLHPYQVARTIGAAVTAGTALVVGSSNAIRDLDVMACPAEANGRRFVVGNRGLAGIDGTVSTAIGVALARQAASRRRTAAPGERGGAWTLAVMGDLTLLHDGNGLAIGEGEPRPDLTIVVMDDSGGSIFATLEQGASPYAAAFERVFATPTGTDIEALCRAHRCDYVAVASIEQLAGLLADPEPGLRVAHVRVDRSGRRELAAAIAGLVSH